MSFRDNLQHLRATRNLTQEQLAMLLGVSRQSVTKWESERAYPEMDKLLKLCSIFDCTLDELVQGDLTARPMAPDTLSRPVAPEDTCGYDAHMRSRAWRIALGVALIIFGVAASILLEGEAFAGDLLSLATLFLGIMVGLACIIPAVMAHSSFVRAHPFVEDFYTPEEKQAANHLLAWGIVCGIGLIFIGVMLCALMEAAHSSEKASASMLVTCVAVAVGCFVYTGLMHSRVNLGTYNQEVADELTDSELSAIPDANRRESLIAAKSRSRLTSSICGIIMLVATFVGLTLLFVPECRSPYFWLAWVFGGITCGITSIAIEGFSSLHK